MSEFDLNKSINKAYNTPETTQVRGLAFALIIVALLRLGLFVVGLMFVCHNFTWTAFVGFILLFISENLYVRVK